MLIARAFQSILQAHKRRARAGSWIDFRDKVYFSGIPGYNSVYRDSWQVCSFVYNLQYTKCNILRMRVYTIA